MSQESCSYQDNGRRVDGMQLSASPIGDEAQEVVGGSHGLPSVKVPDNIHK